MSLQKYIALLKTVELGSISQAAEQMGYTQPAVSRMIADLEHEWNMVLLHRSRAGLEVSSDCQRLLPILRSIVADCEELTYTVGEIHGLHTGLVRVGTVSSVSDMWIPSLLMSFQQLYPNIEFELHNSEDYAEIEDWIRLGKVDCGFVSLPSVTDLQTYFLKRDTLVAVLPENHPMANEPVFPIAQLEGETFIKIRESMDYEVTRFLDQLPFRISPRYEVSSDHTILPMVERGIGISIVHSLIADANRYRVVWKNFDVQQYRDLAIATSKNARLSSATKLFVSHVRQQISSSQGASFPLAPDISSDT